MKLSSSEADVNDENMSDANDGVDRGSNVSADVRKSSTYNLPFVMSLVRRHRCNQFLPFCPTFGGYTWVQQRLCGSPDELSRTSAAAVTDNNRDADVEEPIELQ